MILLIFIIIGTALPIFLFELKDSGKLGEMRAQILYPVDVYYVEKLSESDYTRWVHLRDGDNLVPIQCPHEKYTTLKKLFDTGNVPIVIEASINTQEMKLEYLKSIRIGNRQQRSLK